MMNEPLPRQAIAGATCAAAVIAPTTLTAQASRWARTDNSPGESGWMIAALYTTTSGRSNCSATVSRAARSTVSSVLSAAKETTGTPARDNGFGYGFQCFLRPCHEGDRQPLSREPAGDRLTDPRSRSDDHGYRHHCSFVPTNP
jgi:hypothetical protein